VTVYICSDPGCLTCDYLLTDKACTACQDKYKFSSKNICELCGNGFVEGDEICDAGSMKGCTSDCLGVLPGYICHGGNSTSPTICKIACSICGNGIVNNGEQCDSTDGCTSNCTCKTGFKQKLDYTCECSYGFIMIGIGSDAVCEAY